MEAPDELKYEVYFAHSDNKWGYRDPEHVKKVLGCRTSPSEVVPVPISFWEAVASVWDW